MESLLAYLYNRLEPGGVFLAAMETGITWACLNLKLTRLRRTSALKPSLSVSCHNNYVR